MRSRTPGRRGATGRASHGRRCTTRAPHARHEPARPPRALRSPRTTRSAAPDQCPGRGPLGPALLDVPDPMSRERVGNTCVRPLQGWVCARVCPPTCTRAASRAGRRPPVLHRQPDPGAPCAWPSGNASGRRRPDGTGPPRATTGARHDLDLPPDRVQAHHVQPPGPGYRAVRKRAGPLRGRRAHLRGLQGRLLRQRRPRYRARCTQGPSSSATRAPGSPPTTPENRHRVGPLGEHHPPPLRHRHAHPRQNTRPPGPHHQTPATSTTTTLNQQQPKQTNQPPQNPGLDSRRSVLDASGEARRPGLGSASGQKARPRHPGKPGGTRHHPRGFASCPGEANSAPLGPALAPGKATQVNMTSRSFRVQHGQQHRSLTNLYHLLLQAVTR